MNKILLFSVVILSLCMGGCSIPASARYTELYSLTRKEKIAKSGFGSKKKIVLVKDFRENEMYEEDITGLKEEVELYILSHPDLSEATKASLRDLKVMPGETSEEVMLLLGEPDKLSKSGTKQVWIYRISRLRAFSFFIVPLYFAHEGYYLYFKDNILEKIERHYPKQMVHQAAAPGLTNAK